MTVYLDCNATTPVEPEVLKWMWRFYEEEFGNAGSRTHEYGSRANKAVGEARDCVAQVVDAKRDEVVFTSGGTESNNLAILGLAEYGLATGKTHLISTQVEHKAVLEPLEVMQKRGFEITLVAPNQDGVVSPESLMKALRPETLLVSVMHVNNETGVEMPLIPIAELLEGHEAFFHTDAAQGFGKRSEPLRHPRIDLISVSAHKVYGPMGVGALIARRRGYDRLPLKPLFVGGGQEKGLRPGTLPVPLIAGFGKACEIALKEFGERTDRCIAFREKLLSALSQTEYELNGRLELMIPNTLNVSFKGLDSEAVMVALKGIVALSNGSACTSQSYLPSHVLQAMSLSEQRVNGAVRISWSHKTLEPDWRAMVDGIRSLC